MRSAVIWSLVVFVLAGPLALGSSLAQAAEEGCPCDEARAQGNPEADCAGESRAEHGDEPTGDEQCPDGCRDCGCCPGVVLGAVPLTVTHHIAAPRAFSRAVAEPAQLASGALGDVFRPPRSRA